MITFHPFLLLLSLHSAHTLINTRSLPHTSDESCLSGIVDLCIITTDDVSPRLLQFLQTKKQQQQHPYKSIDIVVGRGYEQGEGIHTFDHQFIMFFSTAEHYNIRDDIQSNILGGNIPSAFPSPIAIGPPSSPIDTDLHIYLPPISATFIPELSAGMFGGHLPDDVYDVNKFFQQIPFDEWKARTGDVAYSSSACQPHREFIFDAIRMYASRVEGLDKTLVVDALGCCDGGGKQLGQCITKNNEQGFAEARGGSSFITDTVEKFKDYKICLCVEKYAIDGAIVEKIANALLAGCVPVFYGHESVFDIFNREAIIYVSDIEVNTVLAAALETVNVLLDDEKARKIVEAPKLVEGAYSKFFAWHEDDERIDREIGERSIIERIQEKAMFQVEWWEEYVQNEGGAEL